MLLQKLREYSLERMEMPPMLYSTTPVRYIIDLDTQGQPTMREPLDTADPKDRESRRGRPILAPQVQRGNDIKPLLLADNGEYTFGLAKGANAARTRACHAAYVGLLQACLAVTKDPSVQAVVAFLSNEPLSRLNLPGDFDPAALVTFTVGHKRVVDLPSVQAFWASYNDPAGTSAVVMQCLVCGQERPVLKRLTGKLKGIPGGQTSGTALISANSAAFESYGLEASLIAPVCAECAERFTKAANELLGNRQTHLVIGGAAFVYWTRIKEVAFDPMTYLTAPDDQQVAALLASVRTGKFDPTIDPLSFYATSLSGSGGRAVVRDWIDTTLGEAKQHVARWLQYQTLTGRRGERASYLALFPLAAATVRDARDLTARTPRVMLHAALTGSPIPINLLFEAVRRNRAEQEVTRPRAALIKLVLASNQLILEDTMVELDMSNPSPAYRCGRLLAVLEEVQRLAIPGIKATVVGRFYGTASSAPAAVFGRLMRGAQPHLAKLQRDKRGAYIALQRRLEDVTSGLTGYPKVLSLQDQGLFALGYYHQRAWGGAQMREAAERKRAGKATRQDVEIVEGLEEEEENNHA